jgi:hypothetical protein
MDDYNTRLKYDKIITDINVRFDDEQPVSVSYFTLLQYNRIKQNQATSLLVSFLKQRPGPKR